MNALLISLLLLLASFTSNQCYQVMESHAVDIIPRREVIRTLLNLQATTNAGKLNNCDVGCNGGCNHRCNCNCSNDCGECDVRCSRDCGS